MAGLSCYGGGMWLVSRLANEACPEIMSDAGTGTVLAIVEPKEYYVVDSYIWPNELHFAFFCHHLLHLRIFRLAAYHCRF